MMKNVKIVSILTAIIMLASVMSIGAATEVSFEQNTFPQISKVVYSDTFDGTKDERIILGSDEVVYSDGAINISGTDGNNPYTNVYFNRDQSEVAGVFMVEYTLEHEYGDSGDIIMYFGSGDSSSSYNRSMHIYWYGMDSTKYNQVHTYDRGNSGYGARTFDANEYKTVSSVKMSALINTIEGKVTLWINGIKAIDNANIMTKNPISRVRFFTQGDVSAKITDFKYSLVKIAGREEPTKFIYDDEFDTDIADTTAVTANNNRLAAGFNESLKQEKGALVITNNHTVLRATTVYANRNRNSVSGKVFVDYTYYSENNSADANMWFKTSKNQASGTDNDLQLNWQGEAITNVTDSRAVLSVDDYQVEKTVRVTCIIDTITGKYSLWINDKLYNENLSLSSSDINKSLSAIEFYTAVDKETKLQNFRIGIIDGADFPESWETVLSEDFEGSTMPSCVDTTSSTTTTNTLENGSLKINKEGFGRCYLNYDKTIPVGTSYILDFTVSRKTGTSSDVNMGLFYAGPFSIYWYDYTTVMQVKSSTNVKWYDGTTSTQISGTDLYATFAATNSINSKVYYDAANSTATLYINGKLAGVINDYTTSADITYLQLTTRDTAMTDTVSDLYLEEVNVYTPVTGVAMRKTEDNTIEFASDKNIAGVLVVAQYSDNALVSMKTVSGLQMEAGKLYFVNNSEVPSNNCKVFLWSNIDGDIKPLCTAIDIQ